jgi:hypothetical protein
VNKDKLVQLLSEALDKNCSINIHFSQFHNDGKFTPVTEQEAKETIMKFAEALGTSVIIKNDKQEYADHYLVEDRKFRICCSYIPETNEEVKA